MNIECLDECEETCGDLVPDVFFRRAQARMLNKFSTEEDLAKAKKLKRNMEPELIIIESPLN